MKIIDKLKKCNLINYNNLIIFIFIVGMLIRIVGIADMPNALNCDEASEGYEAYSILNYGIDRTRK